jgi:hypothetical protein
MNRTATSSHEVAAADTQRRMIHRHFVSPLRGWIFIFTFSLWADTHS